MSDNLDWMSNWALAEAFSLRMGAICARVPLRGSWEPNDRIAYVMASFRLSQEHHSAIHLLVANGKYASANALYRPLLEAALRSLWISEDASEEEIGKLSKGRDILPLLADLNACFIKRGETPLRGLFPRILHNFTHGGPMALAAQFFEGDRLNTLNAAMISTAGMALAAAGDTAARVLGRNDLVEQIAAAFPLPAAEPSSDQPSSLD